MKKILIVLIITIISIIIIIVINSFTKPKQATVTIRNQSFIVEVADTDDKRTKGLSGRENLEENRGMLFVFEKPDLYSFWMKEMKFPIDILFIKNDKIITIHQNVPPPKNNVPLYQLPLYKPKETANYVLEINTGLSQKYNFKEGDSVEMNLP